MTVIERSSESAHPLPFRRHVALAGAVIVSAATLCFGGQQPASSPPPAPLSYAAAVQRALDANPRIAATRLRRAANLASRAVAAERLNPEFRAEFAKETPKEGYSFAVPLELGGKRDRRIEVADAIIVTGDAELNQVLAEVQAEVRRAFFARVVAENRQTLLDDMRMLAERARDAAQARFDAGGVPRLELVQAQLAFADAQNQAAAARGAVDATRASLNALLGFPLDAPTVIDTTLDLGPPLPPDAAVSRARQASSELLVIDRRIAEQRSRLALSHALRTPDLVPEGTLTRRAEPEFDTGWRAALAVTVPIFTTHSAGVRVEEAALAQLASERDAAVARISGEVAAAAAVADAQRQQYVRYRDEIVPQAADVERMAEDSYRLGQTGISAYLLALQGTRDVRLRAIQAAADLQNALADLEAAIGAPLTPLP
ncbi:MAG TPA: TolC family protein [Vicinamibacterales bacterium]|nr:TolC family protein [Vicinamibacterales bacterium]